jgi:hypothetical protein
LGHERKKHLRILIMFAIRKPPPKNYFHKNLKEIEESFGIFENFFFFEMRSSKLY